MARWRPEPARRPRSGGRHRRWRDGQRGRSRTSRASPSGSDSEQLEQPRPRCTLKRTPLPFASMTTAPAQRIAEVADGVVAVVHGQGEAGVSNAGLVMDQGRALVVDTMMFPEMAEVLVTELARRGTA